MSFNKTLRCAVLPIVPICEPQSYSGNSTTYCVFNYTILPWTYADGKPVSVNYVTQLHLYLPLRQDPLQLISSLSQSLQKVGFPCPEIQDVSDDVSQHWVFEFSHIQFESDVVLSE